jgi:hypothetical protein
MIVKQEFFYSWSTGSCLSRRRSLEMFSYGNEHSNISNWKLVLAGDISYTAEHHYAELFVLSVSTYNNI